MHQQNLNVSAYFSRKVSPSSAIRISKPNTSCDIHSHASSKLMAHDNDTISKVEGEEMYIYRDMYL